MLSTLLINALIGVVLAGPKAELVKNLPRMNGGKDFDYNMWSGYVAIPETTKQIHYLLAESQSNPSQDPLIVWFNGGPGCSSMLAFIQEHGPWLIEDGSKPGAEMVKNEYSWNLEANILYIEQPAGVGYSWCDRKVHPEQCVFDDNSMAADNVEAIVGWFAKFPEFKKNDLYISGESYGGMYVPFTVNAIHHHNAVHTRDPTIFKPNLKGFMVGNGCTNWKYDTEPAYMEMAYYHSLYSGETWEAIQSNNCLEEYYNANWKNETMSTLCQDLQWVFGNATDKVNVYNIEGPCWGAGSSKAAKYGFTKVNNKFMPYKKYSSSSEYTPWTKQALREAELGEVPPCVFGQELIDYFNNPQTKTALHINPDHDLPWDLCASYPASTKYPNGEWQYSPLEIGSQWVWEGLKGQYRMLKFSGDTDGAVPTTGTIKWIDSMNRKIVSDWRPYHVEGRKAPAGYIIEYDGLTLGTVHGSGHMAPQFKPKETYHLIFNWLHNDPI